jgi:hypothetical protein
MNRILLVLFLVGVTTMVIAQKNTPALERQVSFTVLNEPISDVLRKISLQSGVKFSYNPATVKVDTRVSFSVSNKPIRTVLNDLFDETIQYKQNGIYIILTYKAPKPTSKVEPIKEININGYIYNDAGNPIEAASIYNAENLIASVSNEYGFYKLTVPANRLPITLKVAKEQFKDTSILIKQQEPSVDIVLTAPKKKIIPPSIVEDTIVVQNDTIIPIDSLPIDTSQKDSVTQKQVSFFQNFLLSHDIKTNLKNISDTFFTKTQIGIIPYVSTNKLLSGNTVNDYSFNILIGYSQGVNKFEIGGLMNIDRGNVQSFQAAGLINAVGGNVHGIQLAGWGNITKGNSSGIIAGGIFNIGTDVKGIQLAGIFNLNLSYPDSFTNLKINHFLQDTVDGIQAAGIFNMNAGHTEGIRLAGLFNAGNTNNGFQAAGLFNANHGISKGANIAGLFNMLNDSTSGTDISALFNISREHKEGMQLAGLFNTSQGTMKGIQLSTLFNFSESHKGTQIALLNIADSMDGIPIGLISVVKHGYHKIEVFGDDLFYTQLAYRTGVPLFHNIFSAGVDLTNRVSGLWNVGYGIGSSMSLGNRWNLTSDMLAQRIIHQRHFNQAPFLASAFIGIEKQFHPKFSISIGPTYHVLFNYAGNTEYLDITKKIIPYSLSQKTYNNGNTLSMWVGGKVSFKFL